ncbi:MAG: endopeptidase La, partial [Myxococcales bacterium]|nr:endopeptidase La [Myxococcales bacterium]
ERIEVPGVLPVLPVRDIVLYPGGTIPLQIGRPRSLAALEAAARPEAGGLLVIATQYDPATEEPLLHDLYPVGTIARVVRVVEPREGGRQALVIGVARARLVDLAGFEPSLRARIEAVPDAPIETPEGHAVWRRVAALAERVIELRDDMPDEWKQFLSGIPSGGLLADLVASNLPLSRDDKAQLLTQTDPVARLRRVETALEREVTIAETQRALRSESELEGADPRERERTLRRRMREIQDEIGEGDGGLREVDQLREKLDAKELPDDVRAAAERELKRLSAMPQQAPDRHMLRTYLEWIADLPWLDETEDAIDLARARQVLDEDHHGLDEVKRRILEFLAVRKLAPDTKAPILCLVGPPGVGKTSLGRSVARTMGRKFARASLGGVRDEAEIRGHRRTYVGAMPGRIVQSLRRAGSRNPVFLLDEIDKLGADFRGDPSSALLEVLDPEQNTTFSDHYLDLPFDLSRALFIATANTLATIPGPLLDRMEVIEIPGYTERDKLRIARDFLVPKQREDHGLSPDQVSIDDAALDRLVREYTREAGVRNLERRIATLMRKAAHRIAANGPTERVAIDAAFVGEALGAPPHQPETAERTTVPGVAVGLAATAHGGDILFIESSFTPGGKGLRLRLTGQLGDVMRESAEAALSWVRANAPALGIPETALEPGEIHLHVPAGATPKDGPSAGVALVTCLVSLLKKQCVRGTVAATGEISLRGRVLPVGGIKSKLLAAARAGIDTIVIPRRNEKDLAEIPADVLERLEIRPADTIEDVLAVTLPG